MALPLPERGMVISYAYLWHSEHAYGREEGIKDRPCVVILAVENVRGEQIVTAVPVTHVPPSNDLEAVEIPAATKRRLGLDEDRSWMVVSEVNRFAWPGPDLRPIAPQRFDYGFLPPALFARPQRQMAAYVGQRRVHIIPPTA